MPQGPTHCTAVHACVSCRYIIQSLPLLLVCGILAVMTGTRLLQLVQSRVFHVLPFGSLNTLTLTDICVGILVSGLFMMYFGEWVAVLCSGVLRFGLAWAASSSMLPLLAVQQGMVVAGLLC